MRSVLSPEGRYIHSPGDYPCSGSVVDDMHFLPRIFDTNFLEYVFFVLVSLFSFSMHMGLSRGDLLHVEVLAGAAWVITHRQLLFHSRRDLLFKYNRTILKTTPHT